MRRDVGDNLELDDDKARIDRAEVHRWISEESYWAAGRSRAEMDRVIDEAQRVVGLYDGDRQIGFARAASDGVSFVYLADVYVLDDYRGRRFGEQLVRFMIDESPYTEIRWLLHTKNMHPLYRKLGFGEPDYKVMERRSTSQASESG